MRPVVALIPPSCCGAGYFRRLRRALPDEVDVRAVELPGRGRRYAEPFVTSASAAVADVLAQIDGPVEIIYGESLGAYIGLAVVAALGGGRRPALVAASNSPPSAQRTIATADADTLESAVATLTSMGGVIPDEVLRDPELAAGAFPLIRADLLLSRSFVETARTTAISGDLTVLHGSLDTSLSDLSGWARHTTGHCSSVRLHGSHLLTATNPSGVAAVLLATLTEL
ncbi:thioesterase II family protein [Streptomyces sp. NPDC001880]